jgi:DNA-binding response OmpR family regulator
LYADDNEDMRHLVRTLLSTAGHEVGLVPDGGAALASIAAREPDLLILDVAMPGLSGFDVCRLVKSNPFTARIPVLMLTAEGDVERKVEGFEAGADDYLAKPFQMGELGARVRGVVRRGAGRASSIVAAGRLRLDTTRMTAVFDGAPARLSPLEFRLLDYLAHQPGRAVTAGELVITRSNAGSRARP